MIAELKTKCGCTQQIYIPYPKPYIYVSIKPKLRVDTGEDLFSRMVEIRSFLRVGGGRIVDGLEVYFYKEE